MMRTTRLEPTNFSRRNMIAGLGAIGACAIAGAAGPALWRRLDMTARFFNPLHLDDFALAPVPGVKTAAGIPARGFGATDLANGASLVVLFATWCPPCRTEHPALLALADRIGQPVYGALYRDPPEAAAKFLRENGNPFTALGDDSRGFFARLVGARGVPTTLVMKPGPEIVARFDGPLDANLIAKKILPALEARGSRG